MTIVTTAVTLTVVTTTIMIVTISTTAFYKLKSYDRTHRDVADDRILDAG